MKTIKYSTPAHQQIIKNIKKKLKTHQQNTFLRLKQIRRKKEKQQHSKIYIFLKSISEHAFREFK